MKYDVIKTKLYNRKELEKDLKEQQVLFKSKDKKYEAACAVEALFQEVTREMQTELKGFLTEVNQQALDLVFPGYEFDIEFSIKNNVTFAAITVGNNGRKQKPMDSNGGGLGNILALCSQMAAKKMTDTRNVILADQPMADLSRGEKEEAAMDLLKTLTRDMNLQYIMISHLDSQIETADKTIEVKIQDDPKRGYPVSAVKSS